MKMNGIGKCKSKDLMSILQLWTLYWALKYKKQGHALSSPLMK